MVRGSSPFHNVSLRLVTLSLGALAAMMACGCAQGTAAPQRAGETTPAGSTAPVVRKSVIGQTLEGRPIECIELGNGGETVLLIGSIHGSEQAGGRLLLAASEQLVAKPEALVGRHVLIVPIANPDGYAKGLRQNAHHVDLNRNFSDPAQPSSSACTEPESIALRDLILTAKPARIISIHQPLACVDYDGPRAQALAEEMSRLARLPQRKLGAKPGSLGTYAGGILSTAVITVELPRNADTLDNQQLWDRYAEMLLAGIRGNP
jgi:murein peptide amidase A